MRLQNFNFSENYDIARKTHWEKEERDVNFPFSLSSKFPILPSLLNIPYNDETTAVNFTLMDTYTKLWLELTLSFLYSMQ